MLHVVGHCCLYLMADKRYMPIWTQKTTKTTHLPGKAHCTVIVPFVPTERFRNAQRVTQRKSLGNYAIEARRSQHGEHGSPELQCAPFKYSAMRLRFFRRFLISNTQIAKLYRNTPKGKNYGAHGRFEYDKHSPKAHSKNQ